jgi:septum formation protein
MTDNSDLHEIDLILASSSPRRHDLLSSINLKFLVIPSSVKERNINGESPEDQVCRLAQEKALDIAKRFPDKWVLGADTIVVIDSQILGKPKNPSEAERMLGLLTSRDHTVYTGYALINLRMPDRKRVRWVRSEVYIRDMSQTEISGYVRTGEPMDKAGAYAIQGIGAGIVERVSGSYTNVVGLPLCEVTRDLKELGIFDFLAGRKNT